MSDWDRFVQMNTRLAGPITYPLPEYPRKKARGMGRVAHLAVASAEKALVSAGIDLNDPLLKSGRVGVAYGSSIGSFDALIDFVSMLQND